MKRLFSSLAVATSALAFATSANAAITLVGNTPGTNPYSGPTPTYTFDNLASTPIFVGGNTTTGTTADTFAQPYGSTGNYYTVGPSTSTPGTIDLTAWGGTISTLSFLWGSVDQYNTLTFLDAAHMPLASFVGNDIFNPANGNQTDPNTNPVVEFQLTGSDMTNFSYLELSSSVNAFEIDNLAINPVPEPATWAMMLLGFGGIGLAMRSRRRGAKLAQIA